MANPASDLSSVIAKPTAALFILVAGVALAFGVCFSIQIIPFALALACFVLLVALSRLGTVNLLIAYIVADHLCQFLKRAIFLLGPEPRLVYYLFQLLPTLILFLAVASSLYGLRHTRFPLSAKLLAGFIAICLAQTFLSPNGSDLLSRFGGTNQSIIPLFAAFAGMAVPPGEWRRFAKLFLVLVIVSTIYGVIQLVHGPTVIDRAWALQTGNYSIEGVKVFWYITGGSREFRAYSYYSDPTMWGFFLVFAVLFVAVARQRTAVPGLWLKLAIGFSLAGLVAAQTRTVWVALLGAVLMHRVLGLRSLRRPIFVITGILITFGLVLSVGPYALAHWAPRLTNNAMLNRYMTVGTISARTSALEIFLRELPRHIVLGDGYGTSDTPLETVDENQVQASDYYSHNAVDGMLLSVGLPGLLTFGVFLYRWLWESLRTVNLSRREVARSQRWVIASCVGMLLTGGLMGPLFLNSSYFMLFIGMSMGESVRLRQRSETERALLALGLNRNRATAIATREVDVRA
jgi:hypothetical protein